MEWTQIENFTDNQITEEKAPMEGYEEASKIPDKTDLFDYWESILPDKEYPVFVIAVLNNIKKDSIIDTIIDSIEESQITSKSDENFERQNKLRAHTGEHPFN